jgi:hypothetical protein
MLDITGDGFRCPTVVQSWRGAMRERHTVPPEVRRVIFRCLQVPQLQHAAESIALRNGGFALSDSMRIIDSRRVGYSTPTYFLHKEFLLLPDREAQYNIASM